MHSLLSSVSSQHLNDSVCFEVDIKFHGLQLTEERRSTSMDNRIIADFFNVTFTRHAATGIKVEA